MKENRDSAIPIDNLSTVSLETLSGHAVSRLGLASQYLKEVDCVQAAFEAGINYFFSYDLSSDRLSGELKPLLRDSRGNNVPITLEQS